MLVDSPVFTLSTLFWSPLTSEGKVQQKSLQFSLPFGAEQVGYSVYFRAFFTENSCLLRLKTRLMTAVRLNYYINVSDLKAKDCTEHFRVG